MKTLTLELWRGGTTVKRIQMKKSGDSEARCAEIRLNSNTWPEANLDRIRVIFYPELSEIVVSLQVKKEAAK